MDRKKKQLAFCPFSWDHSFSLEEGSPLSEILVPIVVIATAGLAGFPGAWGTREQRQEQKMADFS